MTTPACSPEFPWRCPPGIREQMLKTPPHVDVDKVTPPVVDKVKEFINIRNRLFQVNDVATPPPHVVVVDKVENFVDDRPFQVNDVATPPRRKNPEEALGEAIKRLEEQRRREAELFERLDQLKATWPAMPRLIELPESPLAISPWRWALPKPIKPLESETRRKVPA